MRQKPCVPMPASRLGLCPEGNEQALHDLNCKLRSFGLKVRGWNWRRARLEAKKSLPQGDAAAELRNSVAWLLKKRK